MADIVVDASVVAKWYIPERRHDRARALRDDFLDGTHDLLAPALLPYEVVNALKYSGHYLGERLIEASTSLSEYGIRLVPYDRSGPIADIASTLDTTVYDAAYLGLGRTAGATVFTADESLVRTAEDGGYGDSIAHIESYE